MLIDLLFSFASLIFSSDVVKFSSSEIPTVSRCLCLLGADGRLFRAAGLRRRSSRNALVLDVKEDDNKAANDVNEVVNEIANEDVNEDVNEAVNEDVNEAVNEDVSEAVGEMQTRTCFGADY